MVPVHVSEPSVAACPLVPVSIIAMIHGRKPALDLDRGCRHSVNAQWALPTGKSIRVDRFVVASARRAERNHPLLEAQLPSADEIKAWLHHRFRNHRHLRDWTPYT